MDILAPGWRQRERKTIRAPEMKREKRRRDGVLMAKNPRGAERDALPFSLAPLTTVKQH